MKKNLFTLVLSAVLTGTAPLSVELSENQGGSDLSLSLTWDWDLDELLRSFETRQVLTQKEPQYLWLVGKGGQKLYADLLIRKVPVHPQDLPLVLCQKWARSLKESIRSDSVPGTDFLSPLSLNPENAKLLLDLRSQEQDRIIGQLQKHAQDLMCQSQSVDVDRQVFFSV